MKQNNNLWKFLFVVFIIGWSFVSDVSAGVARPGEGVRVARGKPGRRFLEHPGAGGHAATGGNEQRVCQLARRHRHERHQGYFTFINASNETDPTTFILNRLQRDASGKIKLGLDLQGGTAFLVEMDTNALAASANNGDTNAVVSRRTPPARCRRRSRCCASAWTSSAWPSRSSSRRARNQILIQLPGLSEADKESAAANIQKTAFLEFRLVKEDSDEIIAQQRADSAGLRAAQARRAAAEWQAVAARNRRREEKGRTGSLRRHRQERADGARQFGRADHRI